MKKLKSNINVEKGCFRNNNYDITVNMDKGLNMFFFGEYVLKTKIHHSRNFRSRIFYVLLWCDLVMDFCMCWLSCLYVISLFELSEYGQAIMAAEAPKQWMPIKVFWRFDKVGLLVATKTWVYW